MKKLKKMESDTPEWHKLANSLARSFCPPIYPCGTCGHPVVSGYCCSFCHSVEPYKKVKS